MALTPSASSAAGAAAAAAKSARGVDKDDRGDAPRDFASMLEGLSDTPANPPPAAAAQAAEGVGGKVDKPLAADADSDTDDTDTTAVTPEALAAQAALAQLLAAANPLPPTVVATQIGSAGGGMASATTAAGANAPQSALLTATPDAVAIASQPPAILAAASGAAVATTANAPPNATLSRDATGAALFAAGTQAGTTSADNSGQQGDSGAAADTGHDKAGQFESLRTLMSVVSSADGPPASSSFTPLLATSPGVAATSAAARAAAGSPTGAFAADTDNAAQPRLYAAVGSERWAHELGSRLTIMAAQGDQSGSLRLSPEHLGPLEIQIKLRDDQAQVWFGAQHADTRAALQEALPRLRELFAAAGLQLADAGVSREAPRQLPADTMPRHGTRPGDADRSDMTIDAPAVRGLRHAGLLDTYA